MSRRRLGWILSMAILTSLASSASAADPAPIYPKTERGNATSSAFGVTVPDPYRWLEQDVRTAPKVRQWVDAENAVTQRFLTKLPAREKIKARLGELWNFEKFGVPHKAAGRYFFLHNSGLQNQFVLFVQEGLDGTPRVLLDPNGWSQDGATALADWVESPDGKFVVYGVQDGGTDWRSVRIVDVDKARPTEDELHWIKFSNLSWARDSSGFFYSRYPEPQKGAEFQSTNLNHTVYFHRLGTHQAEDRLIFATPDRAKLTHDAEVTIDGHYLVIASREGTDDRCEVTLVDLHDANAKPRTLIAGLKDSFALAGSKGDQLYFMTNRDAPRYRLVAIDANAPTPAPLREIVGQAPSAMESASLVGGRFIVTYIEDAKSAVALFDAEGRKLPALELPGIGSVSGFADNGTDSETFFRFSSYDRPPTIYRYDTASGQSKIFKQPATPFDASLYQVTQSFYQSKDGTRIPIFLAHRRDLDLSRPHPTLLYGYGGFNVSILPEFEIASLDWMEMGGIYAVANLRGGGEYGLEWHDGGRLLNKQNVFDDFIAAAESLVRNKLTTPQQLAVHGASNGGLLIGAVVNQRPDLFAAALPSVGVMDMLRFNQFTAGRFWTDDYGDPQEEVHFRNLLGFSPYHNIHDGKNYPAILVTTADTDDRVVPGHSFKYAVALQAAKIGPKPHLIRIETRAGHGSGKPTDKIIEEYADMWAFIGYYTGLTVGPPQ